jgi:hypothetical protein
MPCRHLALTSRCLQLITTILPAVQKHFESHLPDQQRHLVKYFNQVIKVSADFFLVFWLRTIDDAEIFDKEYLIFDF